MDESILDLTLLVPEFPVVPHVEISRDSLVSRLSRTYGSDCQKQIVISENQYGKTNLLSQFCRMYPQNAIGYFITSNPITQSYRNYLYVICNQMSRILESYSLPLDISENELSNIYPGLSVKLTEHAKIHGKKYIIVIDGIEMALESEMGRRIINTPPILSPLSPYLLFSSNINTLERISDQFKKSAKKHDFEAALQFNYDDTEKYLSDLDLTNREIEIINEKSKGVAGYLAILRDSIKSSGKDWIYADNLPDNFRNLIRNQVEHVFNEATISVRECINLVAISPKPISTLLLQEYCNDDIPIEQICNTGLVFFNQEQDLLSIKHDLAKQIILENLGNRNFEIKQKLLQVVKESSKQDDELLTLILEELNDYSGLVALLDINSIKKSFDNGELNQVIERMRKTSKLAFATESTADISKWSWNLAVSREYLTHASTTHEINALIAIGKSQEALVLAYDFPETIGKIRLLARVYSSMKIRNEHITKTALDELKVMVEEEHIDNLEKEVVQDIAIDLLTLLPDIAVSLLEKVIGESKVQSLIDIALQKAKSNVSNEIIHSESEMNNIEIHLGKLARSQNSWVKNMDLVNLIKEVEDLENTKAKEFMIRRWCLQNTEHDELPYGLEYWLETVIHDENYVITLRSLRQLSSLLQYLKIPDRRKVIDRFQITDINSLKTPWEEWVGFHLNIAEAIFDFDPDKTIYIVDHIYDSINIEINDFDTKVFCYARLWVTYKKLCLDNDEGVKNNLERVLAYLLKHAALQDEILNKTLRILAGIDVDYALDVANRLNTEDSRKLAKKVVIINGYRKQPKILLSNQLKEVLKELDISEQDELINDLISELSSREIIIDAESQKLLFYRARGIKSQIDKSISLVNLASIWTTETIIRVKTILTDAYESWKNEDDLRDKIVIGFQLVERIAKFDKNFAQKFCEDVQAALLIPGAELVIGRLGWVYIHSIDLAIRSLSNFDINKQDNIEKIYDQIDKLPSTFLRNQLYTQLVAKIYTLGIYPKAEEIVQEKILNNLSNVHNNELKWKIIINSLPVIFWYSPNVAKQLSKEIPSSRISSSWLKVILWSLTKGQLGDVHDIEGLKVSANAATIRDKGIDALNQIDEDHFIYWGIRVISKTIESSVRNHELDPINAYAILLELENFAIKNLPDEKNIKHPGYKIVSVARINGARSQIYREIKRKSQFSKIDIRKKWNELEAKARNDIENYADQVFVITSLAEEMFVWDRDKAELLLESITKNVKTIPAILDRSNRLDSIAKIWGMWGHESQAKFYYSQSIDLINEFSPWDQDKKLEKIIQAAYKISPDFADELLRQIDSRFPEKEIDPLQFQFNSLVYSDNLRSLIDESRNNQSQIQGLLIQSSVKNQLSDLVNQNGIVPSFKTINELIFESSNFDPEIVNDVLKWAVECENMQPRSQKSGLFDVFIESTIFAHELAKWVSPSVQKGISQEVHGLLPGLSARVMVFRSGQRKKAINWVKNWIASNAEKYVKICDPYFGSQELAILSDIKRDVKILIITTSEKFCREDDIDKIRQELIQTWRRVGKGSIPSMTLLMVPSRLDRTFHDRAIVTDKKGLDVGPSLNGLGLELQRITELEENEARELEMKYINNMLNQGMWYVNHSVQPHYIII